MRNLLFKSMIALALSLAFIACENDEDNTITKILTLKRYRLSTSYTPEQQTLIGELSATSQ